MVQTLESEEGIEDGQVTVDLRRTLWILAILFFGVGDGVTTYVGVSVNGVFEAGPVAAPIFEAYGVVGMIVMKVVAFGLLFGLYRLVPREHSIGVPLGLALLGAVVTVWNGFVIFVAI